MWQIQDRRNARQGVVEGRGSGLDSGFQMTTDVTFHPSLWLLRSLPWETEELSFGTTRAQSPGKQKGCSTSKPDDLHPEEPGASGTLLNSEGMCAVPTQLSRPQPDLKPQSHPARGCCLPQGAGVTPFRRETTHQP